MKYEMHCDPDDVYTPEIYAPERAHFDDAGIDLRTQERVVLRRGEQEVIDLGVSVQIPVGYFGKMESKSGLMINHGIICMGGVIDSGYRGTIKIRMWNTGTKDYVLEKGEKVVQLVLIPTLLADLVRVDALDGAVSGRNEGGFGSTGK